MVLRIASENEFHGFGNFVIWHWTSVGNTFRGVCRNPEKEVKFFLG